MTDPEAFLELARSIPVELSLDAAVPLLAYLDAMLAENEHVNLTAIRDREDAVLLHALDSVALAPGLDEAPEHILDLGTGNGFPGVAAACLFPDARVVLMDRTQKKLKAIERALQASGLHGDRFEFAHMDAHEGSAHGYRRRFDLITSRAVGSPEELAPMAAPLLARGGRLLCWMSAEGEVVHQLKGALRRQGQIDYELPTADPRRRRLVHYARP